MNRHGILLAALLLAVTACFARGADTGGLTADNMKATLHTATPQEDGFIERVLARVEDGSLPLDLVQSTFLWAKKKPRKKFFYFKQGLILRAADRGIHLS
ncbi:MAG: hypothetical protein ABFC96_13860 [Thermoguttaceae bacterium]